MFKTLTSFFRFYWYIFKLSSKQYDIAMNVNERTATVMTPLFGFLGFVFLSMVFGTYKLASFFPLAIPIILGNIFIVHRVRNKGYEIKREFERQRREAEEAEYRRQMEEEKRRREAKWERIHREMDELLEEMRRARMEREGQRQYEYYRQRQQQRTSNNNMANAMELLGLNEGFTSNDVKKAYRRLSKIHHPDVGGKQENFIKLKKAYDYVMSRI